MSDLNTKDFIELIKKAQAVMRAAPYPATVGSKENPLVVNSVEEKMLLKQGYKGHMFVKGKLKGAS